MAELKTRPTGRSVARFIAAVTDEERRRDCRTLMRIMKRITGSAPKMWGPGIVGYGRYHYRYASGREGDWPLTGFSPRASALTLYIMAGFARHGTLMRRLGRFRTGKSCLYLRRLADVDLAVLEELIERSVAQMRKAHPS